MFVNEIYFDFLLFIFLQKQTGSAEMRSGAELFGQGNYDGMTVLFFYSYA